jgi:hypothetical protein
LLTDFHDMNSVRQLGRHEPKVEKAEARGAAACLAQARQLFASVPPRQPAAHGRVLQSPNEWRDAGALPKAVK